MQTRDAVRNYLDGLRQTGRLATTLRGYETDLRVLVECAEAHDGALDARAVAAYLAWPTARATATQARRLSALRGLLRSCDRMDLLSAEHAAGNADTAHTLAETPQKRPDARAMSRDIDAVFAVIPRQADRDHLLFGLIARLGLRPGEALALRVEDFDEPSASLRVPGWGGRTRRVFVDDRQILLRLGNYVRFHTSGSGALFTAPGRDTPLRYQSVLHRWDRYCSQAGVDLRLSDLRRAHAADLLAGGVPESVVRERIGQRTGAVGGNPAPLSTEESDAELAAWQERRSARASNESPARASRNRAG